MPAIVKTGCIDRIEVENFKSYKGHQIIGPFKSFTAIIGPNGSGKSNLMDAISFVLGVRSMQLRGSQLKDLIYTQNDSEPNPLRRAYVKLVYRNDTGEELIFMRTITGAGSSEYRINGRSASWDEYNAKMRSLGILLKARNFLVFQGDVESIAGKNPKELTAMFEQISSSEELKKDYEELETQKARADEKTMLAYQKKRSMVSDRKQKKEQKDEAERHLELIKKLKELRREHCVWQLYNTDKDIEMIEAEIETDNGDLREILKAHVEVEAGMKEKKKEQAVHMKKILEWEKNIARKKADLDKKNPETVKLKEEMKRVMRRLKDHEQNFAKKTSDHEKQRKDIAALQTKLADITAALTDLTEQARGDAERSGQLELAESQLKEYHKRKEEAGSKTFKLKQEKEVLDRQQQADQEIQSSLEVNIQELSAREQQLAKQRDEALQSKEKRTEALANFRLEAEALKVKSQEAAEKFRRSRARYEILKTKVDEIDNQVREAKADRRENERDAKMNAAIDNLKRLFPGVHGRVTELCRPNQRRYNIAVSIALGRNMDAIVVEDEKTARDCIQYLKEQRLSSMTFIPLQTIKIKPVQERMRTLGGTSKLVIDVIQFEPAHERAFVYACGNTLVCDTLEEAKMLGWGRERAKVVALDGTLIHKSGMMTGGLSGGMEAKAQRWDAQAVESLKKTKERYTKEMLELGAVRGVQATEQEILTAVSGLEKKIQYLEFDLKAVEHKLVKMEEERNTILGERERILPELEKIRNATVNRTKALNKLVKRINEIEDRIFSEFSRSVGVANIREYEETQLQQAQELAERKMSLSAQVARIKNQLEYEQRRDSSAPLDAIQKSIEDAKKEIQRLKEAEGSIKTEVDAVKKELDSMHVQLQETKQLSDAIETKISELKKKSAVHTNDGSRFKRQVVAKQGQLEQLISRRQEILDSCELNQIKLPLLDGSSAMEVDSGSGSLPPQNLRIDYSELKRNFVQAVRAADKEKIEGEFKAKMEALSHDIEKTAPNLKALDQYEALREREKESIEEFETARREAKEVTDKFRAIRQQRCDRFMEAFNHVSGNINPIYKQLTQSSTHPLGGTAYLSLENVDEPFLHGIKFTAMPPTKRFRDMDQLSGGEKTVAALALLFSIHSYRPSPFFVLDEVDAALDNLNVSKVAQYIRMKSREERCDHADNTGAGFQCVVISLKDHFYDKADALVGVYRDADESCSMTLTFDLSKYERP